MNIDYYIFADLRRYAHEVEVLAGLGWGMGGGNSIGGPRQSSGVGHIGRIMGGSSRGPLRASCTVSGVSFSGVHTGTRSEPRALGGVCFTKPGVHSGSLLSDCALDKFGEMIDNIMTVANQIHISFKIYYWKLSRC